VPHDGFDVITVAVGKIVIQQITPGKRIIIPDKRLVARINLIQKRVPGLLVIVKMQM